MEMNRIGVECGGTFTDLIAFNDAGSVIATNKVFSTPWDPSEAVFNGLSEFDPSVLNGAVLFHGSTVATNALIERKGALVGFITTAGFEDIPFLQRQDRAEMYNLEIIVPQPLVLPEHTRGVPERVSATGVVRKELDLAATRQAVQDLVDLGVEAFAISLIHSYVNQEHEDAIAEIIREIAPDIPISKSSNVSAEFREFERANTTITDAFLKPRIASYLNHLETKVKSLGISIVHVMQSNGGIVPSQTAADSPISMLRSGPAAGVAGAISVAQAAGFTNFVTLDMGGTSTDVAVVRDGEAEMSSQLRDGGLPVNVPHVDIVAVGAGGGSIVSADQWGLLSVGPESAGADPGPISYGRGGERITVSDINILREFLRPEHFLGGKQTLYPELASEKIEELAQALNSNPSDLLEDTFNLVNVSMANAVRIATTERGIDPSTFSLFAYGGAGPLHAAKVADELFIRRVVVPPNAGLASAFGLVAADFRREYSRTWLMESSQESTFEEPTRLLVEQAKQDLESYGIDFNSVDLLFVTDMRYRGQGFEIRVPLEDPQATVAQMAEFFNDYHASRYGHADRDRTVQVVTIRLTVQSRSTERVAQRVAQNIELSGSRRIQIFEGGEKREAVFWDRADLAVDETVEGPAIVSEPTSTTYVPSEWQLRVDKQSNLVLEKR